MIHTDYGLRVTADQIIPSVRINPKYICLYTCLLNKRCSLPIPRYQRSRYFSTNRTMARQNRQLQLSETVVAYAKDKKKSRMVVEVIMF